MNRLLGRTGEFIWRGFFVALWGMFGLYVAGNAGWRLDSILGAIFWWLSGGGQITGPC